MKRVIFAGPTNIECYHASESLISELDFTMNLHELGFHCGTYEQADSFNRPYMYKLELKSSIGRVPKIPDQCEWASLSTIRALQGVKGVDIAEATQLMRDHFKQYTPDEFELGEWIRQYLLDHGIHALRYLNDSEGVEYDMYGKSIKSMSYLLLDSTYVISMNLC